MSAFRPASRTLVSRTLPTRSLTPRGQPPAWPGAGPGGGLGGGLGRPGPVRQRLLGRGSPLRHLDWILLAGVLSLGLIGTLLVWSATQPALQRAGADPLGYLRKQLLNLGLGLVLMLAVAALGRRHLRACALTACVVSWTGLLLVLTPLGSTVNGARSWIALPGGFQLEPSEYAKIAVIGMTALILGAPGRSGAGPRLATRFRPRFASRFRPWPAGRFRPRPATRFRPWPATKIHRTWPGGPGLGGGGLSAAGLSAGGLGAAGLGGSGPDGSGPGENGPPLRAVALAAACSAVPLVLVAAQPDLGVAVLLVTLLAGLTVLSGVRLAWIAGFALAAGAAMIAALQLHLLRSYQLGRLTSFLNPSADPRGTGYSAAQSKIAIGSGGLFGHGLLHGPLTAGNFVPEQHTDFIFSVAGEELGFAGSAAIILLLALVILRALRIAARADDQVSVLVAAGIAIWFAVQSFINIGMTIGIMPVTGLPLPFVSYGGSAMFADMIAVGMLQAVRWRPPVFT
jgi:cell division protein FtsW (lipid II flippase)